MHRMTRAAVASVVAALLTGALTGTAAAQEEEQQAQECRLTGTEVTRQAEKLIDRATKMDTAAKARARFEEALKRVQLALESNPEDATAYWLAGRAHVGLGDYARADSMFTRFTALKPACANLTESARFQAWADLYNNGIRLYRSGDDTAALASFEKANVMRKDARSLNNAANIHMRHRNLDEAARLYRQSLEVAEKPQQVRAASVNLAEVLRNQGKTKEALEIYRSYIEDHPEATRAKINYAVTLRNEGMADSARAIVESLMAREDLNFADWFDLGITMMQDENYQAARQAFARARDTRPYHKQAMQNLMNARMGSGQYRPAMALADTLARWYPYQVGLYRTIAQGLDKLGEPGRVQDWLKTMSGLEVEIPVVRLIPQSGDRYVVRGQIKPRSVAGSVRIPFEFLDNQGRVVATHEATIQVPDSDQGARFEFSFTSDERIAGFRYGRISGGS